VPVWDAGTSSAGPHNASPCGSALSLWVCSNGLGTWRTKFSLPGTDIEKGVFRRNPRALRTLGKAHPKHDGDRGNTSGASLSPFSPLVLCADACLTQMIPFASLVLVAVLQSIKLTRAHLGCPLLLQGNGLLWADLLAAKAPDAGVLVHQREMIAHSQGGYGTLINAGPACST
jgi:hypothetical protein